MGKSIQISYELFELLIDYFFIEDTDNKRQIERKIRFELEQKIDAVVRHDLFSKYKTAVTPEEREIARQAYLDKVGMHRNFRW